MHTQTTSKDKEMLFAVTGSAYLYLCTHEAHVNLTAISAVMHIRQKVCFLKVGLY